MMSIRPKKFNVTPENPIATLFFFLPLVPPRHGITFAFCVTSGTVWSSRGYAFGTRRR